MKRSVLIAGLLTALSGILGGCQADHKKEFMMTLNDNWSIQSADQLSGEAAQISLPEFDDSQWVRGDIPATVMTLLRENGEYPNLFMGDNIDKIDATRFQQPWWYRKDFELSKKADDSFYRLRFEGLNYKANIWVNGTQIGDEKKVEGPFSRWTFDVSEYLKTGKNTIAVEIIPPVRGDLTIGFVDWNPAAPDQNMGLWRGVELLMSKEVSLESPYVTTRLNRKNGKDAELSVTTLVTNHSPKKQDAVVQVEIEGIGIISRAVELQPGESRDVALSPKDYPELNVKDARLWWPNNLGEPTLHNLTVSVRVEGKLSHSLNSRFGIREIEQYVNAAGHKGWKINGKPLTIKGAGWVDDMFLADSPEKVEAQLEYVKEMNLNCVRLEGFWGRDKTLYDGADERGLLIMVGWSCHWEWEPYCGRPETDFMAITGKEEIERHAQSYRDQVLYLRNHPSVFLWVFGSDKLPVPELEAKLNDYITGVDDSRPILAACKYQDFGTDHYNHSEVSGATAVKMLGPYGYVPPVYWYIDSIAGGAYGFNTETGPGPQVPPLESIKRMLPEDKLWPINEDWNFHCGRHQFGSLDRYLNAFNQRYGEAGSLEEFAFKSQISNYEAIRPMFEAFQTNKYEATGVIQWMLNSAWPEFFWQLYDYYLVPNGAYYGAKKACQPLSAVYNYGDKNIYWVNDYNHDVLNHTLSVEVYDIQSNKVFSKDVTVAMEAHSAGLALDMPELKKVSDTYFVKLKLQNEAGSTVADNFYWLSTKADKMDFDKTTWVYTPQSEFANLQALNNLPKVELREKWQQEEDGEFTVFTCQLENASNHIAFFNEAAIVNKQNNRRVVPVFWDDNYVSLMPGETKTLRARVATKDLPAELDFWVKGWNKTE
ncbi:MULTISPECIES: glycoside hydrolase family 2 protein [unclassified Carboxylicivirga]|uniref:glycoside hydrolase family 2 protein n=1 Tax=Carboxylicivirga TaxID=1628153 RepID=UPI003D32CA99